MSQIIATNTKAFRNYILSQKWECGIELKGAEVKSIRAGEVNFKDSFARLEKGQVWLYSLYIAPYTEASYLNEDSQRVRKLLLHRREIKKIESQGVQKNLALVPTKIYFNPRGFVKVEIALGQGKKLYDKRETTKKRDIERSLRRITKVRKT